MNRPRMAFAIATLIFALGALPALAGEGDVYLYDDAVTGEVDIGRYLSTGEVIVYDGLGALCRIEKGPAPPPYPEIHMWEPGFERLGPSKTNADGVRFINLGMFWVKNKLALVLWKIQIPNATERLAGEFDEDLTLSMWVDWDENQAWDPGELMIRRHLNMQNMVPDTHDTVRIYYLSAFRVPDINALMQATWGSDNYGVNALHKLWVRGTLACDDADASPDGEQLFGEVEDYLVSYLSQKEKDYQR